MALMDMILEAVSPTPDADFVKAMNAMDRIDDQKFYSSMASMGEYASHKRAKDKTTNKISVDQYLFQMEQQEAVREQFNQPDKTLDPATEEWDNYFAALENELNAIPIVDRTGEDPDVNHPNTKVLIEESDPEREDLPVNPLDEIAPPEDSDDEDYAEVMATESDTSKLIKHFRKDWAKEMKNKIKELTEYVKSTSDIDIDKCISTLEDAKKLADEAYADIKSVDLPDTFFERHFAGFFSLLGLPRTYSETSGMAAGNTMVVITRSRSVSNAEVHAVKHSGKRRVMDACLLYKRHCDIIISACKNVKAAPDEKKAKMKKILKRSLKDLSSFSKGVSFYSEDRINKYARKYRKGFEAFVNDNTAMMESFMDFLSEEFAYSDIGF